MCENQSKFARCLKVSFKFAKCIAPSFQIFGTIIALGAAIVGLNTYNNNIKINERNITTKEMTQIQDDIYAYNDMLEKYYLDSACVKWCANYLMTNARTKSAEKLSDSYAYDAYEAYIFRTDNAVTHILDRMDSFANFMDKYQDSDGLLPKLADIAQIVVVDLNPYIQIVQNDDGDWWSGVNKLAKKSEKKAGYDYKYPVIKTKCDFANWVRGHAPSLFNPLPDSACHKQCETVAHHLDVCVDSDASMKCPPTVAHRHL